MICFIYRSCKKAEMYLYITERDQFESVPEQLLKIFGKPEFSMVINLEKRDSLARVDIEEVKNALQSEHYYLQMPPTIVDDQNFLTPKEK